MALTATRSPERSSASLKPISLRKAESLDMATTMTPPLTTQGKLLRARAASAQLLQLSTAQKNAVLLVSADAIEANAASILEANKEDLDKSGLSGAMLDRLMLNPKRIKEMASGVRSVAKLPDRSEEHTSELQSRLHIVC